MASFAPIRGTRAQIQATPIVDGQFLVETDQGVDNKIYMDEGSTRTIVGGNTVTGVLPELYIYSETGSVVTVEDAGGTSIPTSQVGTDHWICEVPDYGIYNIYSLLDGETTTQSINVDDCMIYTIDDSHFHCNVVVTYPSGVGASCQISGGGETYSAPALNPPDTSYKFVVHGKNTTYTITTNVDGAIKTQTVTTGTILDQTYNVNMPYARVNLTVEMPPITGNVTCTDGTTTITKTATPNMVFYLPNTGSWTFTGSDGVEPYDITVEVNDLSVVYNEDLPTAPDGATVLPTDNIQTWLLCAKIRDKTTYSTLADVLSDTETLQKLINDNNAVDYMVRSKTFANVGLVPILTETSASIISSGDHTVTPGWYAFDNNTKTRWCSSSTSSSGAYLGYTFDSPISVGEVKGLVSSNVSSDFSSTMTLQYYDGSAWQDSGTLSIMIQAGGSKIYDNYFTIKSTSNATSDKWRVIRTAGSDRFCLYELNFYALSEGVTENQSAMRYIGERNYASNTLLDDNDWRRVICNSNYFESVLNVKVPILTSDSANVLHSTTIASYYAWLAFDGTNLSDVDAAAGDVPFWVGYKFPSSIKVYKFFFENRNSSGTGVQAPQNFTIEGSNDDFASDVNVLATYVNDNYNGKARFIDNLETFGNYSSYRMHVTTYQYIRPFIAMLQFYGRQDVDESVYHIHSAANDTITATPQGGGSPITITTLADGHGTIAKSSLPNGTYTFTSSKAENPANLGASDFYSKTINVFNGMIDVWLMPDNINLLYWWGNNVGIEDCYTTYIAYSGYSNVRATFDTNKVSLVAGNSQFAGISNTHPFLNINKMVAIIQGITAQTNEYGGLHDRYTKNYNQQYNYFAINSNTMKKYEGTVNTLAQYFTCDVTNNRASDVYAFWLE